MTVDKQSFPNIGLPATGFNTKDILLSLKRAELGDIPKALNAAANLIDAPFAQIRKETDSNLAEDVRDTPDSRALNYINKVDCLLEQFESSQNTLPLRQQFIDPAIDAKKDAINCHDNHEKFSETLLEAIAKEKGTTKEVIAEMIQNKKPVSDLLTQAAIRPLLEEQKKLTTQGNSIISNWANANQRLGNLNEKMSVAAATALGIKNQPGALKPE
jgi:hypothetical protein